MNAPRRKGMYRRVAAMQRCIAGKEWMCAPDDETKNWMETRQTRASDASTLVERRRKQKGFSRIMQVIAATWMQAKESEWEG